MGGLVLGVRVRGWARGWWLIMGEGGSGSGRWQAG